MVFNNREEAGWKLAEKLVKYKDQNPIILALPRGGVPVGYEVAKALKASLSVIVCRKLGAPSNPELGIGAISEGNVRVLDKKSIKTLNISKEDIKKVTEKEKTELKRRIEIYRNGEPLPDLDGKTVILVDDGLATGVTARAVLKAIKKMNPGKIIFAFPACAFETAKVFNNSVDKLVCLITPHGFWSVGQWYRDFEQVTDEEVVSILRKAEKYHRFAA